MTPLQTLLNDEQKAFEEFIHRAINLPKDGMIDTGELFKLIDKHNSFLALHDQKIITAVIGMCENGDYNDVLPALYEALKKEMI